ncbi:SDR family NAD(P)-dependent oxidoreductase [Paracoccus sp. TK19116]|uniref:SDR family NAD(P)-dependent oxidoreductase n=1 Tax=Paracoccus albicereus TaxID=2922394 RepID=A0ABT1MQ75_9RHOB|nr:SDR family NAD(P)-dependent oxidoreductase [Paracoccus albicereus]MCQ0970468.1 SDR family NAD(P)-dependent oxidoreductase [Paracoccus albicereus]
MHERFAVITGASSGIGYELARRAAEDGHALLICADEPEIEDAADKLRRLGASVETMNIDLSARKGFEEMWSRIADRDIDLFFANAGRALGDAFHEQDWAEIRRRIDLNTIQTTLALHRVGRKMAHRGQGRILVTASIGGFAPGPFAAVYNATKAYLDSLCYALHDEWKDSGVTLTCLMPGPTETPIFTRDRNRLQDAPITAREKDDPGEVARAGYDAMMAGESGVVPGFTSKVITMLSGVLPESLKARIHRAGAEPDRTKD